MSEYQYYEWQTVDRGLTGKEQAAVNRLSSHIDVSSSQAVVTYNWGDFKHDPTDVLLKYFDAHFYLANWGSLRLMFRFPKGLIDKVDIEPYCMDETVTFYTIDQYQVLDLNFNPEDGGWTEPEGSLSDFIQLRADILDGDYRLLYLAWLKAMMMYGFSEDDEFEEADPDHPAYHYEPPVPLGLKKLSLALRSFIDVFGIAPFLVRAAAEASPDPKKEKEVDYASLVGQLSRAECDEFLTRLAGGEAGVALVLRKRLAAFLPPPERPQAAPPRTLQHLLQRAMQLKIADRAREAEAARQRHISEMKTLAAREEQIWGKVEELLDKSRRIASVYDEATGLLEKLQQLSEFQDTCDGFQQHMRRLYEKYAVRPALIKRWHDRGWLEFWM